MAILKDLIVHGSSRFLNKTYASEIQTPLIEAEAGIFKKLKADDATVVGLLDVQGQMHTNTWSNSNIATIDGSFYITPTLSSSSGTVSFSSATAATFTGTYSAVSSLYIGNDTASTVQWTSGSKILITGEVQVDEEWIPLGTLLGTLNSTNPTTSMPIVNITDNRNNTSNILTNIYSLKSNDSLSYRNLKISLYQRADNSEYYPLGIFMTALGQNGKTFLDIYGGVNELTTSYGGYANPNVRIGNLSGLPAITTAAGNFTPVGWGIYTTNGYFSGTIVSNTGVIGGWKLGATGLNNTTAGIYLGTDGIRSYKDTNTYVNIVQGVITAEGVNLTGTINATAGNIGGATITGGVLTVPAANITGTLTASQVDVSGIVTAGSIVTNTLQGGTFNTTNYIRVSTQASSALTIGTSGSKTDWRILAGKTFGVDKAGNMYATSATISGNITATSGTIGGASITNGILYITDANISGTISGNHINVSSINIGDLNGASNYALKTEITDAEKVATSYITYIDSTEGIKIHNILDQTNYLKLNSSAISMYRNNIETLNISNNEIRIGKFSDKNVCIDNDSVDIRNGQTVLSSFGNNAIIIGEYGKSRLMLSPTMISGISDIGYRNFNIISGDSSSEEETITKNGNFENESSEIGVFNGSINFSETFYYFHNITITVVFNYVWDGEQKTTNPFTLVVDDPAEDETGNVWFINGSEMDSSYVIEYGISCSVQHNGEITFLYFDTNARLTPKNASTSASYEIESTAPYSIVIETKVYKNTSYTFGSRKRNSEQGNYSFTIGEQLIASSDNQVAIGVFNNDDPNKNYAFMIGNGIYDENHREHRSNAFTVDCDGNVENMGDLEVGESLIVDGSADNIPNITINKESTNTTDYIKCLDANLDAKFRVLNDGGAIIGNDLLVGNSQTITNNLSVGGNETITGGLTVNGSGGLLVNGNGGVTSKGGANITGDVKVSGRLLDTSSNPLFKVVTVTVDNLTIAYNNAVYPNVAVNATGYTPVAIGSYQISNSTNHTSSYAAWTWAIMGYHLLSNGRIYCYVGNWHSSSALRVKLTFTVLCIKSTAL